MPSEDNGGLTDEDSDNEEWGAKDPNHLGKGILNLKAEMVSYEHENICQEETSNKRKLDDAFDDPGPSSLSPLRKRSVRINTREKLVEQEKTKNYDESSISTAVRPFLVQNKQPNPKTQDTPKVKGTLSISDQ